MLVSTKELYLNAKNDGYAIGAFNVSSLEATKAVMEAASSLSSPVVIETSENEMNYLEADVIFAIVKTLADKLPIQVGLHLDHGKSIDVVRKAIEAGYTSVHIDGSSLSYEENVQITKSVVDFAHEKGITVEGEMGHVSGSSESHGETVKIDTSLLTDVDEAKRFVAETGIDILAVSIGNIHGIYVNEPALDFDRLAKLSEIGVPMSLHGGSGIPEDQVKRAISLGITKVNVNTELRIAFSKTIRRELCENTYKNVPYEYLPKVIESVKRVVLDKINMFGSEGKANG